MRKYPERRPRGTKTFASPAVADAFLLPSLAYAQSTAEAEWQLTLSDTLFTLYEKEILLAGEIQG